jgi:hypothetical protein
MNDKLKSLFPEHKHGQKINLDNQDRMIKILTDIKSLEIKLFNCQLLLFRENRQGLLLFRENRQGFYIECSECYKMMIQFYRDIANLYEELADIKVDKPKNVV